MKWRTTELHDRFARLVDILTECLDEPDLRGEAHESLTGLRERLARVAPVFLEQVRTVVAKGRLDETFVDALCEPAEVFTFGGMIAHLLTLAAHRRTLVAGALESAGIETLGNGDPMLWVAEPTT